MLLMKVRIPNYQLDCAIDVKARLKCGLSSRAGGLFILYIGRYIIMPLGRKYLI